MTISAGSRLGPYEVLSPLGAGGMGEVWKARDTRLGRDVAIKVLPESVARSADALARFQREAKAVAALSHPNILAIHDFGEENGVSFAVMELLEGESLRDLISSSALPVRKAVELAIQIARGLAAAHEKGIVHRDLKPENLFLTRDGHVKILDFGLASQIPILDADESKSPTVALQTEPGTVLGTIGYMSPEQVRGKPADSRSDIFSFGSVLYEMIAGRRPFQGDSTAETMAAIAQKDPPELGESGAKVPAALERVVRHCLEKRPEDRFQSARDLAFDLESAAGSSAASGVTAIAPARTRRSAWLAAVLLLGAAAAVFFTGLRMGARRGKVGTSQPRFRALTHERGVVNVARFSPDGQTIVYAASWNGNPFRLFLARPGDPDSTPISTPDAELLAMSPSGELAISLNHRYEGWMGRGTLARVPLLGGTPRPVLDDVLAADWAPDGSGLAVVRRAGSKVRLEYPVGTLLYETSGWISHPRFSRRGDHIAFVDHPVPNDDRGTIAVIDQKRAKQTLTSDWSGVQGVAWSPSGDEIWFTASPAGAGYRLSGVDLSGRQRSIMSVPGSVMLMDVTREGRVLLADWNRTLQVSAFLPGETREKDLSWLGGSFGWDFSPEDRSILLTYAGYDSGDNYMTYLRATDGSPAARLGEGGGMTISPGGSWAAAVIYGPPSKVLLYPTGTGQTKILTTGLTVEYVTWLTDEKRLVLLGAEPGHARRCFLLDIDGGNPAPFTPEGVAAIGPHVPVSPDGRVVALGGPDGRLALYPVAAGVPRAVPGWREGDQPLRFAPDGRSLFVARRALPIRIEQIDLATGKRELWREAVTSDPAGLQPAYQLAMVSRDARAFLCNYSRRLSTLFLVEGLK